MNRKPDLLLVLALLFCAGVIGTSYFPDQNTPELVALQLMQN